MCKACPSIGASRTHTALNSQKSGNTRKANKPVSQTKQQGGAQQVEGGDILKALLSALTGGDKNTKSLA